MGPGQELRVRSPYTGQVLQVNIPAQAKWVYPQAGGPPAFDFKVPSAPAPTQPQVVVATVVAVGGASAYGAHNNHKNKKGGTGTVGKVAFGFVGKVVVPRSWAVYLI
jgi:hypothetical protein